MTLDTSIIKEFEGFKAKPYLCPAGKATIGYGSTVYPDGKPVKLVDAPITTARAEELLQYHLAKVSVPVINRLITRELNNNQMSALASFVYNTGGGYMQEGKWKPYQLFELINKKVASDELRAYWQKCAVTAGGKVMTGLQRRRAAEVALFFKP